MNRFLFFGCCHLLAINVAVAASPRLHRILLGGIQRGALGHLILEGERLDDVQEIMFFDRGLNVLGFELLEAAPEIAKREVTNSGNKNKDEMRIDRQWVRAAVQVAADCRLGEHVAHVRTASGVTEFRTFFCRTDTGWL